MSDGLYCPDCGEEHSDWTDDGTYAVDGGGHFGLIQRHKCGRCGGIVEGGKA